MSDRPIIQEADLADALGPTIGSFLAFADRHCQVDDRAPKWLSHHVVVQTVNATKVACSCELRSANCDFSIYPCTG